MFCPKCGCPLPDATAFCISCGCDINEWRNYQTPTKLGTSMSQSTGSSPYTEMSPPSWGYPVQPAVASQLPQPVQERVPAPTGRVQVPDENFTKFVDAPDPPLPFRVPKVILGLVSFVAAGILFYQCCQLGTFRLLAGHAKDNIPGISLLAVATLLIVAGLCGILSKMSKGAAGTGAVCYFFAAGIAFTRLHDFHYFMVYGVCAMIFAVIFLVSAAGGVHISLDD